MRPLPAAIVAFAACLGLSACAARSAPPARAVAVGTPARRIAAEEPPGVDGVAPIEGWLATDGAARPPVRVLRFDVDELPVADWGPGRPGTGFTLRSTGEAGGTWHLWMRTPLIADVIIASRGAWGSEGGGPVGFTAFTGGNFAAGVAPACGPGRTGNRLAAWSGFAPTGWTDDALRVELGQGDYDLATCATTTKQSLFGRASAVLRGFVYAFRARQEDDDGRPLESLVVFLPPGAMVSDSGDPSRPLETTNTGPFTRLTFPLRAGAASSASVRIGPDSMLAWSDLRGGRSVHARSGSTPVDGELLVAVDVAWQGGARLGSLSVGLPESASPAPYARLLAAMP